jgi:hypothetical protein
VFAVSDYVPQAHWSAVEIAETMRSLSSGEQEKHSGEQEKQRSRRAIDTLERHAEDAKIAAHVAPLHDRHNRLDENQVSKDNPDVAMGHTGALMDRTAAILLINSSVMEDCAYKFVYGAEVLRNIRTVLISITAHHAKYCAPPTAVQLYEMVGYVNDTARPAARQCVKRAVDLGLVSLEEKGRFTYYYLTPDQMKKARAVIGYLANIHEVVKLQVTNPYDKTAGRYLLPADVYYNIIGIANVPDVEEVALAE